MKTFSYQGFTFKPLARMTDKALTNALANDFKGSFKTDNYSHTEYYKAAGEKLDLFKIVTVGNHVITFGKREPIPGDYIIPCGAHICIV